MIDFPDRLSPLIQLLEAGTDPTPDQIRRVAQLRALDLAKIGEDFAKEMIAEEYRRTAEFAALLEA